MIKLALRTLKQTSLRKDINRLKENINLPIRTSIEKTYDGLESRLLFPDLLRIFSILAVISIHIHSSLFFKYNSDEPFNWWVSNILFSATKWAVPVFVMLSGAFILDPSKSFTLKNGLLKKVLKLLVPFIAWTIICKVSAIAFLPTEGLTRLELLVLVVKNNLLTYHLWFLYMLLGLYFISPIIRAFIKNEPESILIVILVCFIANIALVSFLYFDVERVVYNPLYYFTGFIFYFLSGYYLLHQPVKRIYENSIYILAAISFLIAVIMNYLLLGHQILRWDIFIDNLSPVIMMISLAVFLFFQRVPWQNIFSTKASRIVRQLSNHCYGVYLVHTIILGAFRYYFNFKLESLNIIFGIAWGTISIFVVSLLIVISIKKIKLLEKIIP